MENKDAKLERVDAEIEEISQRILLELESASSKDSSQVRYAKMMMHLSNNIKSQLTLLANLISPEMYKSV